MQKETIIIHSITPDVFSHRGFGASGCYSCSCTDSCCTWGCDVDEACCQLMFEHRAQIEPLLDRPLDQCFGRSVRDADYLGGRVRRSRRKSSGYCVFHNDTGKGCVLYQCVASGLDRRIIPTICRLFPLTWGDGELLFDNDLYEIARLKNCDCLGPEEQVPSIFETQKTEIFELFTFTCSLPEQHRRQPALS